MSHTQAEKTQTAWPSNESGLEIRAPRSDAFAQILTPDACRFVAALARRFEGTRQTLLAARTQRQQQIREGALPDFLTETAEMRPQNGQPRRSRATSPIAVSRSQVLLSARC